MEKAKRVYRACCSCIIPLPASERPQRRHGFQKPFDALQVLSWGLLTLFPAMFFLFNFPCFVGRQRVAVTVVFCAGTVLTITLDFLATISNAADPSVLKRVRLSPEKIPSTLTYCDRCEAPVSRSSRHCRQCNKCILSFDHHCRYLNNCIGKSNYKLFFNFVSVTLSTALYQFAISVYQFVQSFRFKEEYEGMLRDFYGPGMHIICYQTFLCLTAVLLLITAVLLAHLCGFHIMLFFLKKSTYEWLMSRKDAQPKPATPAPVPARTFPTTSPSGSSPFQDKYVGKRPSDEITPQVPFQADLQLQSNDGIQSAFPRRMPEPSTMPPPHILPYIQKHDDTDDGGIAPPTLPRVEVPNVDVECSLNPLTESKGELLCCPNGEMKTPGEI